MHPDDVWPVDNLSPSSWLTEKLLPHGATGQVRSVVPDSFEAHVEIPLLDEHTFWRVRDVLGRTTRDDQGTWAAVMDGWPLPPVWLEAPRFRTPEGELVLFAGTFADIDAMAIEFACAAYALSTMECDQGPHGTVARMRAQRHHHVPSLWWPDDRAWVLAREIDSDAIYLACSGDVAIETLATQTLDARTVVPGDQVRIET